MSMHEPEERIAYSIQEFANLTGLDRGTVSKMVNDGTLPAIRTSANGRWLISRAGVDAAFAANLAPSHEGAA